MRWLLAVVALVALLPAPAQASLRPHERTPPERVGDDATGVVVVAVPGLLWSDVGPATPALARLAATGAVGALSVKAGPSVSCAADGLLTLAAGARATAYGATCGSAPPDLAQVAARNLRSRERADIGALPAALACTRAVGPLSQLLVVGLPEGAVDTPAGGEKRDAAAPATSAAQGSGGCPWSVTTTASVGGSGASRRDAAAGADAVVAQVDAARPAGMLLLVLGVSEAPGDRVAHLHVAIADGPGFARGALVSSSTQRSGYVQLVDVAPTVLTALGRPVPPSMSGLPFRVDDPGPSVQDLVDLDLRATAQKRSTVPFFVLAIAASLLALGLLRRRRAGVALVAAAVPGASFLAGVVPWWRAGQPLVALSVITLALALLAALAVRRVPGRFGPAAAVCGLTVLVVAADLVTGARLQITAPTGYSPLVAGRFAGIGNVAFGVYAAAGLLATAWLARGRLWVVAACGLLLVAVDGAPPWGSDVGGVLALLPALVLLALLVTGRRVSLVRLALAGLAGAALVTAVALADHARGPAQQTHLGRFVTQVQDGTAGTVLRRKADAVFGLLFHSPVTALLPLVVAGAVYLLLKPPAPLAGAFRSAPELRHGLLALSLACALGFALNDSGAAVPALALLVALPVATAVASRPG